MSIKEEIQEIINDSLINCNINIEKEKIIISPPKDSKFGDYSTNIAMILTKELHKNPMEIAEDIKNNISSQIIEKIEIVKPGFINIFLTKKKINF